MSDWYYSQGGQKKGPVSNTELKQLALSGQLRPSDKVWRKGMDEWAAARNVPGLFDQDASAVPDNPAYASEPAKVAKANLLVDYLTFRRMITPIIIQIIFWIGAILFVLFGLYQVFDGLIPRERARGLHELLGNGRPGKGSDLIEVVKGLLTLVVGPIAVRIYCELLILFFRMNETLTEIKNNTEVSRNP